jgi:uncharacterized membrane protein YgaE (UPF0421/DUF939 family)
MEAKIFLLFPMTHFERLQDDLKYFEGLLLAYDGEDKKVRAILRSKIAEIRQNMAPFLANITHRVNCKKQLNNKSQLTGTSQKIPLRLDCLEPEPFAIYSLESA